MGGGIDVPGSQRSADHLPELAQPGRHLRLLVLGGCCTVVRSSPTAYRLLRPALAWLSCSGVMHAPSNVAQSSRASRKSALRKSAPVRSTSVRSASLRFALLKSAALRSAAARLTSPKLASLKSIPFSSIAVSGCSSLHLFHIVALPCFSRSNCC